MSGSGPWRGPLPLWERRLTNFLRARACDGALAEVPHQYVTAMGQPKCVRCGEKVEKVEKDHLPACTRCSPEVQRVLVVAGGEEG